MSLVRSIVAVVLLLATQLCFAAEADTSSLLDGSDWWPLARQLNSKSALDVPDFTPRATQPGLQFPIQAPETCAACHAPIGTPPLVASLFMPHPTWSGSMMANATRDPIFWAALDVANHDVPGVGDACLRCHATKGWTGGHVVKNGAGGLNDVTRGASGCLLHGDYDDLDTDASDFSGVACHFCHRIDRLAPDQPTFGNGNVFLSDRVCTAGPGGNPGNEPCRIGPYAYGSFVPPHPAAFDFSIIQSDICGNCHNVSSPQLGGATRALKTLHLNDGTDTGRPFPIERTFAEWQESYFALTDSIFRDGLGDFSQTPTAQLLSLATCQTCHMPISETPGTVASNFQNTPGRTGDLAIHEFVGGNAWVPTILRGEFGAGLGVARQNALDRTSQLARGMLASSAKLELAVTSFVPPTSTSAGALHVDVKVTNLSGHKLPTGYGEGRRMWIDLQVNDLSSGALVFESGAYDNATGVLTKDPQARVYEVLQGIWNRTGTGTCETSEAGKEFFHFVLNDCIAKDNRIPPQGFRPSTRTDPNAFDTRPVGANYGPLTGTLSNVDTASYTIPLPPGGRHSLRIGATLRYQTSSKDYIEFLRDQATTNATPAENAMCTGGPSRPFSVGPQNRSRGEYLFQLWNNDPNAALHGYGKSPPETIQVATAFQF